MIHGLRADSEPYALRLETAVEQHDPPSLSIPGSFNYVGSEMQLPMFHSPQHHCGTLL